MKKKWYTGIAVSVAAGLIVNGCGQPAGVPSDNREERNESAVSVPAAEETASGETEPLSDLPGTEQSEDGYRLADDYYEYMNHTFLEEVEVPAGSSGWNYFYELETATQEILEAILEDTTADREQHEPGSGEQKITDLYLTAMDKEEREAAGFGELSMYLDRISAAGTVQELLESAAWAGRELKLDNIFTLVPAVDRKDTGSYAVYLLRPDLGPGKEVLEDGSRTKKLEEYVAYVSDILALYDDKGGDESRERAAEIVALQQAIAAVSLPDEERWNLELTDERLTGEELQEMFYGIDMEAVLDAAGIRMVDGGSGMAGSSEAGSSGASSSMVSSDSADMNAASGDSAADGTFHCIVMEPEAEKVLAGYLTEENLPLLKDYSIFCLIDDMTPYLAPSVRDRKLLYERSGEVQEEQLAIDMTMELLEDEFGRIYVERCFSEESKIGVEAMTKKIVEVYQKRIEGYDWLSSSAKENAKRKLEKMAVKAGYPAEWPDELETADILPKEEGGSLIHNVLEVMRAKTSHEWEQLQEPVDRTRWHTAPQTVQAYYDPQYNELVLPAAVLQAPFYDKNATEAENLGGIGTIIAHEIIHAFDAVGSLTDENGNSAAWWTDSDYENYRKMEDLAAEYYTAIETSDGGHIDGRRTLRENMADLGAIACVTEVVEQDEAAGRDEEAGWDKNAGQNENAGQDEQAGQDEKAGQDEEAGQSEVALRQMYERYAQIWSWKSAAGNGMAYKSSDDRSPAKVRVNAVLSSEAEFYEAYPGIQDGDGMYIKPEKRVGIW